jgi:hypothetical protein
VGGSRAGSAAKGPSSSSRDAGGGRGGKGSQASSGQSSSSRSSSTAVAEPATTTSKAPAKKPGRKLNYYEELEYKAVCKRLEELEKQRNELNDKVVALAQSGTDLAELERCSVALGECGAEEERLGERWLELAELAGDL